MCHLCVGWGGAFETSTLAKGEMAAVDCGAHPAPGSRGYTTLRPLAPLCRRSGDLAPRYFVSTFSGGHVVFCECCGGQNHLDVARTAAYLLERRGKCVRTSANRAGGDSAPRSASRAQNVLHRVQKPDDVQQVPEVECTCESALRTRRVRRSYNCVPGTGAAREPCRVGDLPGAPQADNRRGFRPHPTLTSRSAESPTPALAG